MVDEAKSHSWWQTLPGLLTALAAGITAISGLIAALYQAGIVGRKDATPSPAVATTDPGPGAPASPATAGLAAPSPPPAPLPAVERQVELPDGTSVTMFDGTGWKFRYEIVGARLEPTSPQKQLLRLRVRVWTNATGGVNFWSDSFRLQIGDLRLKPVNSLNELAAKDETREDDIEFEVDTSVKEAVLSINVGGLNFDGNTKALRLKLG